MRRDRKFLEDFSFAESEYGSIVQTDYPGAHDQNYRARVSNLIDVSKAAWPFIPTYDYTKEEHSTWEHISDTLLPLQDMYACAGYLEGREKLNFTFDKIPQLDEVSKRMEELTGFMMAPVGGLLEKGEFLSILQHKVMRCTPYIRHPEFPFFTPEPDIVHELRGHAPMFTHEPFVEMSMNIGKAAAKAVERNDEELLDLIGLFYWFTVEYGLIRENGEIKIFGAGNNGGIQDLLRSMDPTVEKRPISLNEIKELTIDYDAPQELFFVSESFEQIAELANELAAMAN